MRARLMGLVGCSAPETRVPRLTVQGCVMVVNPHFSPTTMATASALPRPLTATVAPVKTWLPLNVTIDANDRGDSPELISRARAWDWSPRDVSRYLLNACKVAAFGRDVLLSGSASPVLRRAVAWAQSA